MTAVLGEVLVAAAAALMFVCLCWAMSRGERDRACPVRPVPPPPPRRFEGDAGWRDPGPVDPNAPWLDPEAAPGLSPAELRAAVRLMGLYREAAADLVAREEAAEARRAAAAPAPTSRLEVA